MNFCDAKMAQRSAASIYFLISINLFLCYASNVDRRLYQRQRRQATIGPQRMQQILATSVAGVDYPNFVVIPKTSFSCPSQQPPNSDIHYVDVEAGCQLYHRCVNGQEFSFLCPVQTLFNVRTQVCDWFFQVKCNNARVLNGNQFPEKPPRRQPPVFVKPPSGSTPGVIITPFQFIIGFWTPPTFDASGNVHIDKCFACQFLSDAQNNGNKLDPQTACASLIESTVEQALPPAELDTKLSEMKNKNANDPTIPLLQCCHQQFASKLFEGKSENLQYNDPPGLMQGKNCGDFLNSYTQWMNGGGGANNAQQKPLESGETIQQ